MNLRLIYKTNHEGFKKLYGFKADKSETIWGVKIESQISGYSDVVRNEYESTKFDLDFLSKQTGINDEHLVVVLTHLSKSKNKDYIPKALIELGNLNIREIMFTSMLFLNALKKIINLAQMMQPELNKKSDKLHQQSMNEMFKPMYDMVEMINSSNMDDAKKKEIIKMLRDSKSQLERILK